MTVLVIPLQPVPAQTLTTQLADQNIRIDMRQLSTGFFVDVYLSVTDSATNATTSVPLIQGRLARNLTKIVRGMLDGDLYFYDTQGVNDPAYDGLGSRYILLWDSNA